MESITPHSVIALFDTDKEGRRHFIENILLGIDNGSINPLDLQIMFRNMEDIINGVNSDKGYKDALLAEAESNGKSFHYKNAEVNIREVGTKYDYDVCGSEHLKNLEDKLEAAKAALKHHHEFLKAIHPKGVELLNEETGEVSIVYPPAKTSSTSVTIKLK